MNNPDWAARRYAAFEAFFVDFARENPGIVDPAYVTPERAYAISEAIRKVFYAGYTAGVSTQVSLHYATGAAEDKKTENKR